MMGAPNRPDDLQEKDFIHEEYSKNPRPFWVWLFASVAFVLFLWGSGSWYFKKINEEVAQNPFLQVTNREMSVFLWQFSDFMPQHVKDKSGYLPGFVYQGRVGIVPETADNYVTAPPELLFLYHTWDRLLKPEFSIRRIPREEFLTFLDALPEWQPQKWHGAPPEYGPFVAGLHLSKVEELSTLSESTLPLMVRMAFQGWKNYVIEQGKINELRPTYGEMEQFLSRHRHYTRSYWRNLVMSGYPKYLYTLTFGKYEDKAVIPNEEITPFLRVAYYNFVESLKDQL